MDAGSGMRRALAVTVAALTCSLAAGDKYSYCIVGAGPGGVQLGHYFSKSRAAELRDYVVFERAATAGYFFRKYPKHRELISINKRHLSPGHPEGYAFRQDWNSLIGRSDVTPVPLRSRKFFPQADLVADYIEDFASDQVEAGRIVFNTSVNKIHKQEEGGFQLNVSRGGEGRIVSCGHVIMANGLWTPKKRVPNMLKGAGLLLGYDELPTWDASDASIAEWDRLFEAKEVAILGLGNAAMEVAQAILPIAASVHMMGRSKERYSDKTHYPGDIRANRREILDHYQLKMTSTISLGPERMALVPCFENQVCFVQDETLHFFADGEGHAEAKEILSLLEEKSRAGLVKRNMWRHQRGLTNQQRFNRSFKKSEKAQGTYAELQTPMELVPSSDELSIELEVLLPEQNKDLLDLVLKHRQFLTNDAGRDPFDVVIRCTGWQHNISLYDRTTRPALMSNGKHAEVTDSYESVNVSGLYFAGTLAHGPDFRKSAGGFIHGFRYTTRALSRILEYRRGLGWSAQRHFRVQADLAELAEHILHRMHSSSGPYHMFDQLVEGIVLAPNCTASYLEEVPKAWYANTFGDLPRVEWVFNYANATFERDMDLEEYAQDHQKGYNDPFLHPIVRYYGGEGQTPRVLHLRADFFTRWKAATAHVSMVRRFLEYAVREAYQGTCAEDRAADLESCRMEGCVQ